MNKQDKQKELERLHDIVFEGMPPHFIYAAKQPFGNWIASSHQLYNRIEWVKRGGMSGLLIECKNQPTTTLDWTDTLIQRKGET